MSPRTRIRAFGSAAALVLAGVACGVLIRGVTGEVLAIALVSAGLGAAVLLVFLEVGLSEDRELARDERRRRGRVLRALALRRGRPRRPPRRPE